jgi:hypothetical protein
VDAGIVWRELERTSECGFSTGSVTGPLAGGSEVEPVQIVLGCEAGGGLEFFETALHVRLIEALLQ